MSVIASILMVASGALCVIGAVAARSPKGIVASSVMLAAMVDLVTVGLVPPVVWAAAFLGVWLWLTATQRTRHRTSRRRSTQCGVEPVYRGISAEVAAGVAPPAEVAAEVRSSAEAAVLVTAGAGLRSSLVDRPTALRSADHSPAGLLVHPAPEGLPEMPRTRIGRFAPFARLGRTAAILSAATFPIMAWQILNHGAMGKHSMGAPASGGHGAVGHQHMDMSLIGVPVTLGVIVLSVLLLLCAAQALAHKRPMLAFETVGMAAMIAVMQFVH